MSYASNTASIQTETGSSMRPPNRIPHTIPPKHLPRLSNPPPRSQRTKILNHHHPRKQHRQRVVKPTAPTLRKNRKNRAKPMQRRKRVANPIPTTHNFCNDLHHVRLVYYSAILFGAASTITGSFLSSRDRHSIPEVEQLVFREYRSGMPRTDQLSSLVIPTHLDEYRIPQSTRSPEVMVYHEAIIDVFNCEVLSLGHFR
jgi:hypothetical protein